MHMLGSEGGNPHLSLTQPPLSPSLLLICQLRVCRVWASAQVKGSKSGSDSLLGPIGPSTRWPLTFDPFTFYRHYSLKTNHHLIRIRSTHACFPAIACMSDSSIYVPSQTTLKSDWKHPSWGLFFFLAAAETWPTNCFVLQCRFSLGQRALSLLEAPRGADDRCTGWWDERKANGMLLFQRGESPPWKPSMCLVNVSSLFVFHAAMWQCFPTLLERRMNWSWGKERCFWCWNAVRMAGSRARPCTRARLECFLGTTWAPSAGQVILISILYTHTHRCTRFHILLFMMQSYSIKIPPVCW